MTRGGEWKELLRASESGDVSLVKYHLSNRVDPNWQHPEYFTAPIFEGIRNGRIEVVQALLQHGKADTSIVEEMTECQPLEVAIEERQHEIVDLLLKNVSSEQASLFLKNIIVTTAASTSANTIGKKDIFRTNYTELIKELLKSGHRVTVLSSKEDDITESENNNIALLLDKLKRETGNNKLYWIPPDIEKLRNIIIQQQQQLSNNVWIHIHHDNSTTAADDTTDMMNKFLGAACRKIKILPSSSTSQTEATLATKDNDCNINSASSSISGSSSSTIYIMEPNFNSWYNYFTWLWWYPKYLETIVNFATTSVYVAPNDDLRGKLYNYLGMEM